MSKKVSVRIKGISPMLMHRFPMEEIKGQDKMSREDQAEISAYRVESKSGKGELYVPGPAIQQCLNAGAAYVKGKGRSTLKKIVAAAALVTPDRMLLGITDYEIDSRPVVNPSTQGRIIRHRPKIDVGWEVAFDITYDPTLLKETQLREVVDFAGSLCGLLDYRPAKNGPFGRFMVTEWIVEKGGSEEEEEKTIPEGDEEGGEDKEE